MARYFYLTNLDIFLIIVGVLVNVLFKNPYKMYVIHSCLINIYERSNFNAQL